MKITARMPNAPDIDLTGAIEVTFGASEEYNQVKITIQDDEQVAIRLRGQLITPPRFDSPIPHLQKKE